MQYYRVIFVCSLAQRYPAFGIFDTFLGCGHIGFWKSCRAHNCVPSKLGSGLGVLTNLLGFPFLLSSLDMAETYPILTARDGVGHCRLLLLRLHAKVALLQVRSFTPTVECIVTPNELSVASHWSATTRRQNSHSPTAQSSRSRTSCCSPKLYSTHFGSSCCAWYFEQGSLVKLRSAQSSSDPPSAFHSPGLGIPSHILSTFTVLSQHLLTISLITHTPLPLKISTCARTACPRKYLRFAHVRWHLTASAHDAGVHY